ncbi:MAG: peptidoglycan synthetase [Bacteroidetes bacterium]|nr:MAG: peptidoglycan synthetase [Bacteroidota bacterium]
MHNLAIALKRRGYKVTGSDDAIYDPARGNLKEAGLLPSIGWDASVIDDSIDVIILGMHARKDNPELKRSKELGLKIMSFPEFVASESSDKKRVVVAGSHGKTTTTAMIMHVLSEIGMEFDFLVGSSINGFDLSVKLTDAPLIIIEGDEYLSSPMDLRSKFLWYKPHYSIITGIAYDHINVFPTFDLYIDTFRKYIETHTSDGEYYWFKKDPILSELSKETRVLNQFYDTPEFVTTKNGSIIVDGDLKYPLSIVGKHNLENLVSAQIICEKLGVSKNEFYSAAKSFSGAGRRMEKVVENEHQVVYRDFAHSPSKLKATTEAIKETYDGNLLAVFELHTFSSLNKEFLPLYQDTMESADRAIVFYNDSVFAHKKMEPIAASFVIKCFKNVEVVNSPEELTEIVNLAFNNKQNILLMSSGKFEDADFAFN